MAGLIFHRHADAAMQLNCLLADISAPNGSGSALSRPRSRSRRDFPVSALTIIAAKTDIDRACSSAIIMSTARCCKAWKLPIGTPNCLRVFRKSTVRAMERLVHRADRLGGQRRDAGLIDDVLQQRGGPDRALTEHGVGADLHAVQRNLGNAGMASSAFK